MHSSDVLRFGVTLLTSAGAGTAALALIFAWTPGLTTARTLSIKGEGNLITELTSRFKFRSLSSRLRLAAVAFSEAAKQDWAMNDAVSFPEPTNVAAQGIVSDFCSPFCN